MGGVLHYIFVPGHKDLDAAGKRKTTEAALGVAQWRGFAERHRLLCSVTVKICITTLQRGGNGVADITVSSGLSV